MKCERANSEIKKNVKLYGALNTASVAVFVHIGVLFWLFKIVCAVCMSIFFILNVGVVCTMCEKCKMKKM